MKILNIRFKNFRSFGDETYISLEEDMNIILGENNVGKSNILNGLNTIRNIIQDPGTYKFLSTDWHDGFSGEEIKLEIEIKLEQKEISIIFLKLFENYKFSKEHNRKIKKLKNEFSNSVKLVIVQKEPKKSAELYLHFGSLFFDSSGSVYNSLLSMESKSHIVLDWTEILNDYDNADNKTKIFSVIQEKIKKDESVEISLKDRNIFQLINKIYSNNIKFFSDIRQKPIGENRGLYESLTGEYIDDVLLNLKNGNRNERRKYNLIKEEFNTLFPNLELEAIRDRSKKVPGINIIKKSTDHEVPLQMMGTGIIEIVTVLTNMVEAENQVFGLEEPELHLHPQAQKLLFSFMSKYSNKNQILLLTHSPYFINTNKINNIILVKEKKGKTTFRQIHENNFNKEDSSKLSKILDINTREIFFSKKVLLVEGETEIGALPIFANKLNKNFDKNGISIIWVGGKNSFRTILKLLLAFEIPYSVMCDQDSIMEITAKIKVGRKKIPMSSIFTQLYKIGILKKNDVEILKKIRRSYVKKNNQQFYRKKLFEPLKKMALNYNFFVLTNDFEGVLADNYLNLLEEAKSVLGRSKPRIGKYVAEKIVKENKPIPKEFSSVIKKL